MRVVSRLLRIAAGLLVLSAGVTAAVAQEGETSIPAEALLSSPYVPPGPWSAVEGAILLFAPLFPLIMAWTALPSRRYRFARTAAVVALLLASAQGAWGLLLLLDSSTGWGAPSLLPDIWELRGLLNDPPEWFLFLGIGSVWAAATWLTIHGIDSSRAAPPPAVAGSRVRAKAPTASGAAPAPRG